jgi:hypothetical protein
MCVFIVGLCAGALVCFFLPFVLSSFWSVGCGGGDGDGGNRRCTRSGSEEGGSCRASSVASDAVSEDSTELGLSPSSCSL